MDAVILHVANTIAARAIWPPDDVVPSLRGGDLALHICQQLLRLGQGQPQFGDIAKAIRPADLHEIRAWILALGASLHQPQNPCHAPIPGPKSGVKVQLVPAPPSFAAVPRTGRRGARLEARRQEGQDPCSRGDEARHLLDSIDTGMIVGLRDRALIGLLICSLARIPAPLHMNVEDYCPQGKCWWVRLHEKVGKQHEMPVHHLLASYIDAYVTTADICADKTSPLFSTLGGRGRKQLGAKRMSRQEARRMIVRRARQAGIIAALGCHTFRAIGITVNLRNGGLLEYAQQIAARESARTKKLYDRRNDQVTPDQIERIVL
jgi:hypothetical protein